MENYYDILEVEKNASPEQIKKSYKRLALQWHPDKNTQQEEIANSKFQKISEAYSVLSNHEKRLMYEKSLYTPIPHSTNPFAMFNSFFGSQSGVSPLFQTNTMNNSSQFFPNSSFHTVTKNTIYKNGVKIEVVVENNNGKITRTEYHH